MLLPFIGWGWLLAAILDKDVKRVRLNQAMWNSIQLCAGAGALAAMLFIPTFWASWPVGVVVLTVPILVYWQVRNRTVPESDRFYLTGDSIQTKLAARKVARASKQAAIRFVDPKGKSRTPPYKEDPLFEIHILAEELLSPAISARASRVEMKVMKTGAVVSQVIDGIPYKRDSVATEPAIRLIDYLKEVGGLDVTDRRRKQSGSYKLVSPEGETEMTVVTAGSSSEQLLRVDFDRSKRLSKPFDGLGLLGPQLEVLRETEQQHDRHGIILIGAPRGHGLTTTSYSFISRHDAYTSNVKTLERDIILVLDGVDQILWDPTNPEVDYASNLQSILRRDPDIVLTDLLVDRETAQIAADPGITGPLIYIQQPLPTIVEQIRDWVKRVGDLKEATNSLRTVTNQRLFRSLCPNCRQAYQPTPEQLKRLNLSSKKVAQLHRASGKVQVKNRIEDCAVCNGSGYLGQTAAFEIFNVDDEARKLLASGDLKAALAYARRNGMIFLQEAALTKVVNGETTLEEIGRVMSVKQAAQAGKSAAA